MLKIARCISELDFEELMRVYEEGNATTAAEMYTDVSVSEGLILAENDFYDYLIGTFFTDNKSFYAIWCEDGNYAAALRVEPYKDGCLISALETIPHLRNRGLAKKLLHSVIAYIHSVAPTNIYSHVSKCNQPSLLVHKACGFNELFDYAVFLDGSVSRNSYTLCLKYE